MNFEGLTPGPFLYYREWGAFKTKGIDLSEEKNFIISWTSRYFIRFGLCPICRKAMISVPDIVDEAVASAIDQNCEVFHVIPGCGLEGLGRIGALLRYKITIPREEKELRTWGMGKAL